MGNLPDKIVDELLVLQCQEGNREAFNRLVSRWQDRLWRHACQMTGSEDAAWDVVQETWAAVVKGIRRLERPSAFPRWVYAVCTNRCVDWVRDRQRQRKLAAGLAGQGGPPSDPPPAAADAPEAVRRATARLPEDQRAAVSLYYGEGLSVGEVAEVLGVPEGTVKSRLYHAREALRRLLESDRHG
jgi:RNA polymerase sigma factor (sigma-70 family)